MKKTPLVKRPRGRPKKNVVKEQKVLPSLFDDEELLFNELDGIDDDSIINDVESPMITPEIPATGRYSRGEELIMTDSIIPPKPSMLTGAELEPIKATTRSFGDPLLEHSLSQELEQENTIKSVSKELFTRRDADLKTEVSHDEINDLTRLRFLEERFGIDNVAVLTNSLLSLRISKDRKSRREFIESLQQENRNNNSSGLLARAFGVNNNNNNGGT